MTADESLGGKSQVNVVPTEEIMTSIKAYLSIVKKVDITVRN